MARKPPKIKLEVPNKTSIGQVCESPGVYAVLYQGEPFNYRQVYFQGQDRRYSRTVFHCEAHAVNLVTKLNRRCKCDDFSVKKLI